MAFSVRIDGIEIEVKANRRLAHKEANRIALDQIGQQFPATITVVDYKGDISGELYYDSWNIHRIV